MFKLMCLACCTQHYGPQEHRFLDCLRFLLAEYSFCVSYCVQDSFLQGNLCPKKLCLPPAASAHGFNAGWTDGLSQLSGHRLPGVVAFISTRQPRSRAWYRGASWWLLLRKEMDSLGRWATRQVVPVRPLHPAPSPEGRAATLPLPNDAQAQPAAGLLVQVHREDLQVVLVPVGGLVPEHHQPHLLRGLPQGRDGLLVTAAPQVCAVHLQEWHRGDGGWPELPDRSHQGGAQAARRATERHTGWGWRGLAHGVRLKGDTCVLGGRLDSAALGV